jgi:hypothetical protein
MPAISICNCQNTSADSDGSTWNVEHICRIRVRVLRCRTLEIWMTHPIAHPPSQSRFSRQKRLISFTKHPA